MNEHIDGMTIAQNGFVSYEGSREEDGVVLRSRTATRTPWHFFDWRGIPARTVVIDARGCDSVTGWQALGCCDYPSYSARVSACREAGLRITTVREIRAEQRKL